MDWGRLLKILSVFYLFELSQNSHVQHAKDRIRAEVGSVIGHSPHVHYHQSQRYSADFEPHQYDHFYEGSRRVRRLHRNRWSSGHRKSMEHHHFTGWSAWSVCSSECIKRRERYCKLKRKCGFTKHVEERKCLHCFPNIASHIQASKYTSDTTSHSNSQQQQQQQTINQGGSPPQSIIINAAAAASGPTHHQFVLPTQQSPLPSWHETVVHHQIHMPVLQETIDDHHSDSEELIDDEHEHHYEREEELPHENDYEPKISGDHEELLTPSAKSSFENSYSNDYETDGDDFYVFNSKPRYRKHRHQNQIWVDTSEYSDFDAEHLNNGSDESEIYSGEPKDYDATQFGLVNSLRSFHRKRNKRRKSRQRLLPLIAPETKEPRLRNLSPHVDDGIEGDTFQYEDFDFDHLSPVPSDTESDSYGYVNQKLENHFGDSYEDNDYDDMAFSRNSTFLLQSKEKATPDALIPRHRRLYSKWSRWTKCSPKCTTRRYKKCRVREQCGREVLREIAYCYTEGSFCQQWLQAQVQKSSPYELRPMAASRRRDISVDGGGAQSNSIVSDYIMNSKGYRGPEYTPMKLKCGIAPMRNGKRSMHNMLKIIGGKASRKGEWPWQVAIFNRFKEAFCGGTLIAPQWVLTAAHCVRKVLYVRIGEHNLDYEDGTEMQLRVMKSFKHPNFDKKTVDSDVALLKLPKPVNTTTWIGFSCLPRPYQPLPKNVDCTVIGWGKRRNRDAAGTSVLHQADVPIISMDNCRSVYQDYTITKNMFCAGHKRGRVDTCAGDSGGPLLCRDTTKPNHPWTIFGITSFGDGCAKRNKFGIYAKVPNYVDWVWSVINCNGNCKLHQRNYG